MKLSPLKLVLKNQLINYGQYYAALLGFLLRVFGRGPSSYGVAGELYRDLNVIYDFLKLGNWPLLGPSSSLGGFNFGAVYYYLTAPFVWIFNFAPYGAGLLSLVCSTLSIILVYKLTVEWFEEKSLALLTVFCQAICVYDIQYSYFASNPNTLPFFVLLFMYELTVIAKSKGSIKRFFLLGLSFAIGTQLHATAMLLLPLVFLATAFSFRDKFFKKDIFIALVPLVAVYIPYLIYEFHHHFSNLVGLGRLGEHNFALWVRPGSVLASVIFWQGFFVSRAAFFDFLQDYLFLSAAILIGMLTLFTLQYYRGGFKQRLLEFKKINPKPGLKILFFWLFFGQLMFLLFQHPIAPFYFLVIWPLPIILFCWFEFTEFKKAPKLSYSALGLYAVSQIIQLFVFYPAAYKQEFSHKNIMEDFSYMRQTAGERSFNILNGFMDPNEFLYYKRITNTGSMTPKVKSDMVFSLCLEKEKVECEFHNPAYQKQSEKANKGLFMEVYLRKSP